MSCDFKQQITLANLTNDQQMRIANLTAENQAGSENLSASQQTELANLNSQDQPCLNANADTVAGAVAIAMESQKLIFMTDVEGVYDSSRKLIKKITHRQLNKLIASNVIHGGMIPKLNACLEAVENLCTAHIIDGRKSNALKDCLTKTDIGTNIVQK